MSDSGRMIGECEHGYQRWHCETCKLRAVADRLAGRVAMLERCVAFFASVIKSGEPWSETCEAEYRKAVSDGN